ncbi:hypothetical protein AAFF_G00330610 [Aldrovandia affinis]|uniref:Uncharacterized protein n=1 Tax=Aldrovandia affinis TaxID=143900 RepID=A0AAD7R733_9TELE|nr:hypothetical protein AAFF_G00330610 [Aldrovandia affinis]
MEERTQELEIQLKYLQEVRAGSAQGNAELSEDGPVPNTVALERERVVYLQQDPPQVQSAAPALRQALRHCQTMEAVVNSAEAHNIRVQGIGGEESTDDTIDEWVQGHRESLEMAYDQVQQRLATRRRQRDQRYKSQVHDPGLKEGQLVYTRNHSVKGRNKIQDTWDSTPYRVVQQPDHQGRCIPLFRPARMGRCVGCIGRS